MTLGTQMSKDWRVPVTSDVKTTEQPDDTSYSSKKFWRAYASLFYCPPAKLSGLRKHIEELFSNQSTLRNCRSDLRVLCLGMGVGTFDFPVLHVLEECCRAVTPSPKLKVLGLDCHAAPLWSAAHLFPRLAARDFPMTAVAFADAAIETWHSLAKLQSYRADAITIPKLIEDNWKPWKASWVSRTADSQAMFSGCVCDVDFLELQGAEEELQGQRKHICGSMPSDWANHLRARMNIDSGEDNTDGLFDVVISAFCLHHLFWRRVVAIQAASLLRPGGVFLLGSMDSSDAQAFQGILSEESEHPLLNQICERYLAKLRDREAFVRTQLRRSGAHHQIEILDLLQRAGMRHEKWAGVDYGNPVRADVYRDLLETRGLTPLRELNDALGQEVYDELLQSVRELDAGGKIEDTFKCSAVWHALWFPDRGTFPREADCVAQKFLLAGDSPDNREAPQQGQISSSRYLVCNEYELLEANVLSDAVAGSLSGTDQESVRQLVCESVPAGVLHSHVGMGAVGIGARRSGDVEDFFVFYNPLARRVRAPYTTDSRASMCSDIAGLVAYLLLRRVDFPARDYSNSNVLLDEFLPIFPMPVVFHYWFHEGDTFRVALHRHRTFFELAFFTPCKITFDKEAWGPKGMLAAELWRNWPEPEGNNEKTTTSKNGAILLSLPKGEFSQEFWQRLDKYARENVESFAIESGKWVREVRKACEPLLGGKKTDDIQKVLEFKQHDSSSAKSTAQLMLETMIALARMHSSDHMVIYPCAVWNRAQGILLADDSMVFCYDTLTDQGLRHDFRKLDVIYQTMGMKKSAASGAEAAWWIIDRALGHEVGNTFYSVLKLFEKAPSEEVSQIAVKAALNLGLIWSKIPADMLPPTWRYWDTAKRGKPVSDYVSALLQESWQLAVIVRLAKCMSLASLASDSHDSDPQWVVSQLRSIPSCAAVLTEATKACRFKQWTPDERFSDDGITANLSRWLLAALVNAWKHSLSVDLEHRTVTPAWRITVGLERQPNNDVLVSVANPLPKDIDVSKLRNRIDRTQGTFMVLRLAARGLYTSMGVKNEDQADLYCDFGPTLVKTEYHFVASLLIKASVIGECRLVEDATVRQGEPYVIGDSMAATGSADREQ